MTRNFQWAVCVAVIAIGVCVYLLDQHDSRIRAEAIAKERTHLADSVSAAVDARWQALAPKIDTVVKNVPVASQSLLASLSGLRAQVASLAADTGKRDTVPVTVTVPVEVVREIIRDSDTLSARCQRCALLLAQSRATADSGFAAKDKAIALRDLQLRQATKRRPGLRTGLALGVLGALGVRLLLK